MYVKLKLTSFEYEKYRTANKARCLAYDRGKCRSARAKIKPKHENKVENYVENSGNAYKNERMLLYGLYERI